MSKIWVTNESSSFAKSFAQWCDATGKHDFINSWYNDEWDYFRQTNPFRDKEIDLIDPTLPNLISRSGTELIIHQLPVPPEKCELHPDYTIRSNIEGSYYIAQAAKEIDIPVLFITTKNYFDTFSSQPNNMYDVTARAVENILDIYQVRHISIIPATLYGSLFHEGVSGLIRSCCDDVEVEVGEFNTLLHCDDFFDAIDTIIDNIDLEFWNPDRQVISIEGEDVTIEHVVDVLRELGQTPLYSVKNKKKDLNLIPKARDPYGWKMKIYLKNGIKRVWDDIRKENDS